MANLKANPTPKALEVGPDQDLTHQITLPMGTYLTGGASAWALEYKVWHPVTGTAVFTKTQGAGISVTQAGSAAQDAKFLVTIPDTDIEEADVSASVTYKWRFKRNDAGSEVIIDRGTVTFPR